MITTKATEKKSLQMFSVVRVLKSIPKRPDITVGMRGAIVEIWGKGQYEVEFEEALHYKDFPTVELNEEDFAVVWVPSS